MTAQVLNRVLTCYRIGDPAGMFPIFDARGSTINPGRWNTAACPVLYTSEHYSTAMLEKLVHGSGRMPPNQHFIRITIPNGITYEVLNTAHLPDWYLQNCSVSKPYGDSWQQSKRSLLLIVPNVVAREEKNFLINPQHPNFAQVQDSLATPIWWGRAIICSLSNRRRRLQLVSFALAMAARLLFTLKSRKKLPTETLRPAEPDEHQPGCFAREEERGGNWTGSSVPSIKGAKPSL